MPAIGLEQNKMLHGLWSVGQILRLDSLLIISLVCLLCPSQLVPCVCDHQNHHVPREQFEQHGDQLIALGDGLIKGKVEKVLDRNVESYLGVPYAEPPIGELRFRKPRPFRRKFDGIYNATYFRSACMQRVGAEAIVNLGGVDFNEDCLHLNVWVPQSSDRPSSDAEKTLKPVLFYIFASAFHKASPARPSHRGEYLSAVGDIIVVTPNYRLGFLSFACCGLGYDELKGEEDDADMPGNLGLHDIILALKWTRSNIARFGGDPDAITLSGASAGAMLSMMLLHASTVPEPWIRRAFIMSGVPINEVTIDSVDVAMTKTRFIAQQVKCSLGDYRDTASPLTGDEVDCLRKSANLTAILELQDSEPVIAIGSSIKNGIVPVYGDMLVPKSPELSLLVKGTSSSNDHLYRYKSIVFGNNENEGSWETDLWATNKSEAIGILKSKLGTMLKTSNRQTLKELQEALDHYFGPLRENDSYQVNKAMSNFYTDYSFVCPVLHYGEQLARNKNLVHLYKFNYVPQIYLKPNRTNERPFGALHGDDTKLIFGAPFRERDAYDHHDRLVACRMMEMFTGFVKNERLHWPPILVDRHQRIEILRLEITGQMNGIQVDAVRASAFCKHVNKLRNHKLFERH